MLNLSFKFRTINFQQRGYRAAYQNIFFCPLSKTGQTLGGKVTSYKCE